MSNMTKSAVMVKPLRAFKVIISFEGLVIQRELPGGIDECIAKQCRTTLGHTGRFSGKLPGLANCRVKIGVGKQLARFRKTLAEYAANILGADIYEIVPAEPYTEADLAYYTNGRADREQNDPSARPEISGGIDNISDYDTIILGYPIWHGQAPRIICTFLESYDFSGKTIIPFCTSHSSGMGSSADNLHALCSAEWESGKRFGGGVSKDEINEWLQQFN